MFSIGIFTLYSVLVSLGYFAVGYLIRRKRRVPKGLRLPPGPPGKHILGHITTIHTYQDPKTVAQWHEQYGDIVYLNALGTSFIFLKTLDATREIFERRSSIYSDRQSFRMIRLMGWGYGMGFMPYGDFWRRHRRTFHQYFNQHTVSDYEPIQIKYSRALLRSIQSTPEDFVNHLKHLAAAIIIEIVYGIKLQPKGDRFIEIANTAQEGVALATNPGFYLVDLLPALKYIPEWIPGAGFKKKARLWRKPTVEMSEAPFRAVKEAISTNTAKPSIAATCLEKLSHDDYAPPDEEIVVRNTCGVSYAAGAGTSATALISFVLAMVLFPETQRRGQAELDAVLGEGRLPSLSDRERLPYVNALCQEVQRWRPVFPLAVAHAASQDDIYGEYFIPKGSIVMGNAWAILHDERLYGPRPDKFEPERFLKPGVSLPTAQWGFGRRICPGRYLADNTLFFVAASMLKAFNISHAQDEQGNEIPVAGAYTPGAIMSPEPFQCSIKPRSASANSLVLNSEATED